MISEIFEYYYTIKMHPARLAPLSKEELSHGMPMDAVEKYLALIQKLFELLSFDVNAKKAPLPVEERRQTNLAATNTYNAIIKHLFTHDAISDDTYCELHKTMSAEFNFIEHPDGFDRYICDTVDDFRLAFELSILENNVRFELPDAYLDDRYGFAICVRPGTTNGWVSHSDLQVIRFDKQSEDIHTVVASYWEVRHLLKRIKEDIKSNNDEQNRLDSAICPQRKARTHHHSPERWTYKKPNSEAEWYTMKRALLFEQTMLKYWLDNIQSIFECMQEPDVMVGNGATLYIYKGNISCHQKKHLIVPATAILFDELGREIRLDVEFCPHCDRYLLNYVSFARYRERYTVLIGKLKMIATTGAYGELELAPESPLKLCGYNVSQTNGLSVTARQYILSKIIHDGIMTKNEVIRYLEHFINLNGAKKENSFAVQKWCEDLDFVHAYRMETQPQTYISRVTKY